MTRNNYEMQLSNLEEEIQKMGAFVDAALLTTWKALEEQDAELAQKVIHEDRYVNDMQRSIEANCLSIITKQQPLASDLRMVSAALKVVTDIERIGDHAADIAELVIRCKECDLSFYSKHMKPMLYAAREMVEEAIDSLIKRDSEKARLVIAKDDIVDGLFNEVKGDVVAHLQTNPGDVDFCIDALMIAKYLERVGDHAVNICEWEVFQETGTIRDVRIL